MDLSTSRLTDADSGTVTPLTRRLGFPLHALLMPIPIGALTISVGFDIASHLRAGPCSGYPRSAFLLLVLGIISGVVAGAVGLPDLVRLRDRSQVYRAGVRHVVLTDVALAIFVVSALLRRGSDWCRPVGALPLAISVVALLILLAGAVVGLRLTYRMGVGSVADDSEK
jgi:uncharacterized membrane protein